MGILSSRVKEIYSDIDSSLSPNPINQDIMRVVDENAIKTSIKNLLLTNKGERVFKPTMGSNIRRALFENITPDLVVILKDYVITTLEAFEPRINIIDVQVISNPDQNSIGIVLTFNIQKSETPITYTVIIDRVH